MKISDKPIQIALVDDHVLLRNALATLINSFENYRVCIQAGNGKELIEKIKEGVMPEIILLDLNMPVMDGQETAKWLFENHPELIIVMLTMYDSELVMIRLLRSGVKGFLKKDIHPEELKTALVALKEHGYYYNHRTTGRLMKLFLQQPGNSLTLDKNLMPENEIRFLQLAATELTYKEIALKMNLNPRSVDNLRDNLFTKLDVKSRVGLVMFALRHGLVSF